MSENPLPNSVGRLDDVVEAIKTGRIDDAVSMLASERERREAKYKAIEKDCRREAFAIAEVQVTLNSLIDSSPERIEQLRRACGWEGGES